MRARREREEHAGSFGRAAGVYDAARPGYPAEAVAWLVECIGGAALDLGAGTGKLTAALAAHGLAVTAVDPAEEMLEVLRDRVPGVTAMLGTAEHIPLPDAAVDLVTAAQAWHWVDPALAVPEVARVLRPGGRLALVWNDRDESVEWVRELGELMGAGEATFGDDEQPVLAAPFGPLERHDVRWAQSLSLDGLLDLARSRSYFITKPPETQAAVIASLRRLHAEHPDLAGAATIELPYVTRCYRAVREG